MCILPLVPFGCRDDVPQKVARRELPADYAALLQQPGWADEWRNDFMSRLMDGDPIALAEYDAIKAAFDSDMQREMILRGYPLSVPRSIS